MSVSNTNLWDGRMSEAGDQVRGRIRGFLKENFLFMRPDFNLDDNAALLETGVVDSIGVAEFVEFVEEEFGLHVEDDEITEENLGSVEKAVRFILKRRESATGETG